MGLLQWPVAIKMYTVTSCLLPGSGPNILLHPDPGNTIYVKDRRYFVNLLTTIWIINILWRGSLLKNMGRNLSGKRALKYEQV